MASLVASDIDGTLLRSDGTVSDRSRAAIEALEASGGVFILVTGRPPRWLAPITAQVAHRGIAICANGGIVLDLHDDSIVQVNAFDGDVGRDVLAALRTIDPTLVFGVEWADGFAHEHAYAPGVRASELVRGAAQAVGTVDGLFARPVVKLLARVRHPDGLDELAGQATAALGEQATVTWSSTGLLEISAAGVTKAAALERFAGTHDLGPADVVAVGDMPNDVPMLLWAGRGVAVANAHDLVIEAADEVTASNDDDGVAQVVEALLAG